MSDDDSVSEWLDDLQKGDRDAAEQIWRRFVLRLTALARKKLGESPRRAADEDDILQSVFQSFFDRAEKGRFPELRDRDDLWRLLAVITERKVLNQRRNQGRLKRGGGKVQGESAFLSPSSSNAAGLGAVAGREPTPEFAVEIRECLKILMDLLDEELRKIVIWKMQNHTNAEIAELAGCSVPTIERRLKQIRLTWQQEFPA